MGRQLPSHFDIPLFAENAVKRTVPVTGYTPGNCEIQALYGKLNCGKIYLNATFSKSN